MGNFRIAGLGLILAGTAAFAAQAGTAQFYLGGAGSDGFTSSTIVAPTAEDLSEIEGSSVAVNPYSVGTPISLGTGWQGTEGEPGNTVTLTVTPMAFSAGASGVGGTFSAGGQTLPGTDLGANPTDPDARLTQQYSGLGIMNNSSAFTDDQPYQVDGSSGGLFGTGWFDFLVLDFDRQVSLDFTQFGRFVNGEDTFRLIYDGSGDGILGNAGDFLTDAFTGSGADGFFEGFPGLPLTTVGIAAVNPDSAWQLHSLGVSWEDETTPPTETPDIAPVPLPASALLLLAGLGGLAALRRRG